MTPSETPEKARQPLDASLSRQHHGTILSDLCCDVLIMICQHLEHISSKPETPIKNLSQTNRRLRIILAPWLFKKLTVNVPVKLLHYSPLLSFYAQKLKVDMFGSMWWWCSGVYVSGDDAMDIFQLIHKLGALRTLEVRMMRRSTDIFSTAFNTMNDEPHVYMLEKMESLIVTSGAAFLAAHCPNLKTLFVGDDDAFAVEMYSDLRSRLAPLHTQLPRGLNPHLSHIDVSAVWFVDELSFLVASFPHAQHLCLGTNTGRYHASFETLAEILGNGLKELKVLKLNKISDLDLDFRPVLKRIIQRCDVESQRKRLWHETELKRVKAENYRARELFTNIPSLSEIWLGENRVARRMIKGHEKRRDSLIEAEMDGDRWMWERKTERFSCCPLKPPFDKFEAEQNAAIVSNEMGM